MATAGAQVRQYFHSVNPYVIVSDARAAIDFYSRAFGAVERSVRTNGEGKVLHAEVVIGDSALMLAEEFEFRGVVAKSPRACGSTSVHLYLYVPDVDQFFATAVAAGAHEVMPASNQPYGERSAGVMDPFGHVWWMATVLE
ncbi:MAG: VOC family protein [Gemmatimonadota bacterium]